MLVQEQDTTSNHQPATMVSMSWRSIGFVALATSCIFLFTHDGRVILRQPVSSHSTQSAQKVFTGTAEACSFEQLQEWNMDDTTVSTSSPAADTCWKLQDEILRVPTEAIVNRHNLPKLGNGCLGGVYKAVIELPVSRRLCSVALKTDNCYGLLSNPWAPHKCDPITGKCSCERSQAKSCVLDDAGYNYNTFQGGEYTGALPWYAQLETGNYQEGLLPTWASVHTSPEEPMKHWLPRSVTNSIPHPDPTAVGVIMPLRKFAVLESMSASEKTWDSVSLARLFLPAAKGLELLSVMGLAFQDMMAKNVGIVDNGEGHLPHAILFDNSYIGLQDDVVCAERSCEFCRESIFPAADRKKVRVRGQGALSTSVIKFRNIVLDVLDLSPDATAAAELREALVDAGASIETIVGVLESHTGSHRR